MGEQGVAGELTTSPFPPAPPPRHYADLCGDEVRELSWGMQSRGHYFHWIEMRDGSNTRPFFAAGATVTRSITASSHARVSGSIWSQPDTFGAGGCASAASSSSRSAASASWPAAMSDARRPARAASAAQDAILA